MDAKKSVERTILIALVLLALPMCMFAGTGGTEVSGFWNDIKGFLAGKGGLIIACFMFIGGAFLISDGKKWGIVVMFISLMLGTIPAILESRYTMCF